MVSVACAGRRTIKMALSGGASTSARTGATRRKPKRASKKEIVLGEVGNMGSSTGKRDTDENRAGWPERMRGARDANVRERSACGGGKRPGPVTPMLDAARSTEAGFEEDVARRARYRGREGHRVGHRPR